MSLRKDSNVGSASCSFFKRVKWVSKGLVEFLAGVLLLSLFEVLLFLFLVFVV